MMKFHQQPYRFKAKRFGRGWYPATRQGWLVIALFVGCVVAWVSTFPDQPASKFDREETIVRFFPLLFLGAILIFICYLKGEKPGRHWGRPKKEENKESLLD